MRLARGVRSAFRRLTEGPRAAPFPPEARLGNAVLPPPSDTQRAFWLECLRRAYPDCAIADKDARDAIAPAALLDSTAPLDSLRWRYALAGEPLVPPTADPGRARPTALFTAMYGDCRAGEVEPRLERVRWVEGSTVRMTRVNGIAAAFERVARALEAMPADIRACCRHPGAGYQCRAIEGSARRSMHAYGAAFDLDPERTHYWLWEDVRQGGLAPFVNTVPLAIVAAFEAEGFIWGGRWAHFDTMHFEYRPELILAARG